MSKSAFNIAGAAEEYSVSDKKIRAAIKAGTLKAKRAGRIDRPGSPDHNEGTGEYLISAAALAAWFESLADA